MIEDVEVALADDADVALVILCCRIFLKKDIYTTLEKFVQTHIIDWPAVYLFSAKHRIRPVIYHILSHSRIPVDEQVFQRFRNFCHALSVFAFDRQIESLRIQQLLRQKSIPVRRFKGLDFAMSAYGDLSMREFTDMDLIIDVEDISALVEVMNAEGYKCKGMKYFQHFSDKFIASHKDIYFEKRCPHGKLFNFEFHYRPAKYITNVYCSFADILGPDYLSVTAPFTRDQQYQLMLMNHGGDYYPDLRSLLDLALLLPGNRGPVPERFEQLWQLLATPLLNYPSQSSTDRTLQRVARVRMKRLLSREQPAKTYIDAVSMHIRFSQHLVTKLRLLMKALKFLILPNENDINELQLPYFHLYYFTKPLRLVRGMVGIRKD
jgi:hypothetical protein